MQLAFVLSPCPCLTYCLHLYFSNLLWNMLGCVQHPRSVTLRLHVSLFLYSHLTPHYPLPGTVGGSAWGKFPGKFPFCKCRIFLRCCRDAPSAAVLRGQKQGAEWPCWISNSLPLAGATFKRLSLNEALAVPSWRFIKAHAGASEGALEWKQGERGPAGALCPPAAPSASCSWAIPPAHKRFKQLFFVLRVFVVVVVVVVTFSQCRAHRSKERSEYLIAVIS